MSVREKNEHLKALGFELVMDTFTVFILIMAYKYTYDTFNSEELTSNMSFIKNAFVYLAPGSIEGFRIITSESRENKGWDGVELMLSVLSIIVVVILMLQCIFESDKYAIWYVFLIIIYLNP